MLCYIKSRRRGHACNSKFACRRLHWFHADGIPKAREQSNERGFQSRKLEEDYRRIIWGRTSTYRERIGKQGNITINSWRASRGGRCPWFGWIAASLTLLAMTGCGAGGQGASGGLPRRAVALLAMTGCGGVSAGLPRFDNARLSVFVIASPFWAWQSSPGRSEVVCAAHASAGLPRRDFVPPRNDKVSGAGDVSAGLPRRLRSSQ